MPGDIVGRAVQRRALLEAVTRTSHGVGGATVVTGAAGVGKTALVDQLAAAAASRGLAVARIAGTRAESRWPYAGVNLLYSAIGAVVPAIGDGGATGATLPWPSVAAPSSTYDVALAAQAVIDQIRTPLVVMIDDAHLVDAESQEVVGFLARRLPSVPVTFVLAVRDDGEAGPPFAGLTTVRLPELNTTEAVELVRRAAGGRLSDAVAERVVTGVGGNPRALIDVVEALSDDQRSGQLELGRYLPHSARLRRLVLPDLDTFDEAHRFAVLVAALNEDGRFASVAAALAGQPDAIASWLAHRHLTVVDGSFRFRRPAARSVIWHAADLDERSRAHLALAEAYAGRDRELELWHRAHATHDYDPQLAVDLQRVAGAAGARGERDRSVAFATHAVRLEGDTADRVDQLVLSCQVALHSGRIDAAVRHARERLRFASTREQQADLALLEAHASNLDDGQVAVGLIAVEADEVAPVDPDRAARLHLLAARQRAERLEIAAAWHHLGVADEYRASFTASTLGFADSIRAWVAALAGSRRSWALSTPLTVPAEDTEFDAAQLSLCRARALIHHERYDDARILLNLIVRDRRYGGSPVLLGAAYVVLADLEVRAGRVVAAARAVLAADRAMGREWGASGRIAATLVRVSALLGDTDEVRARRDQAAAWSQRTGEAGVAAAAHAGTGFHLLAQDRAAAAVPILERARDHAVGYADPAVLMTEPDLIEACYRAGDAPRARALLREFEIRVKDCPSDWGHAALARSRALVVDGPDTSSLFRDAIDAGADCPSPIELGRVLLAYGEHLHRQGRREEASTWLSRAALVFDECGAKAMVARAQRELGAAGPGTSDSGHATLTAAELRVASLAASGLRNREIAAQLYVSTRTVEGHLGQVFRKLGIRSRVELAGILSQLPGSSEPD